MASFQFTRQGYGETATTRVVTSAPEMQKQSDIQMGTYSVRIPGYFNGTVASEKELLAKATAFIKAWCDKGRAQGKFPSKRVTHRTTTRKAAKRRSK